MLVTRRLVRMLLIPLVAAALFLPASVTHADSGIGLFQATFSATDQLTGCGTNVYCISDQGTGSASGLGAATMTASETETLIDQNSPCGFQVAGTTTLTGTGNDTLSLRFTLHTCGFGTDDGATLIKPGTFVVTGGTGRFAGAWGLGSMYKIGVLSSPAALFQFKGIVSGAGTALGDQSAPSPLGGARCTFGFDGIHCLVQTTNTIASYPIAQCGNTAINGQYVLQDSYTLGFDPAGLAVRWHDAEVAPGSLSNPVSGKSLGLLLIDTQDLRFAAAGNFESATTVFGGPGLVFLGRGVPPVKPAQISYDGNGRIAITDPATLTPLCAALS